MAAELLQLAREAVTALQTPNWAEIAAVIVSGIVGLGQLTVIGVGLFKMQAYGKRRDKEIAAMVSALERQSEALGELFPKGRA